MLGLMSESTRVATATAVSDPAVTSDSDLCWRNVIKINLEARQQVDIICVYMPPYSSDITGK